MTGAPDALAGTLLPDSAVRGVARILEPGGARKFARALAEVIPLSGRMTIAVVKQRLGQRALLRVDIETIGTVEHGGHPLDPAGSVRSFYVKIYRRKSEERVEVLRVLAASAPAAGACVPAPVGWIPRYRALVTEAIRGRPVLDFEDSRFAGPRLFSRLRVRAFEVGRVLAHLHAKLPPLGLVAGPEVEIARVLEARSRLATFRPDLVAAFDLEFDQWRKIPGADDRAGGVSHTGGEPPPGSAWDSRRPLFTLHGDFHPEQVLLDEDTNRLAVLDWDEACFGDPERDAGNFLAHLRLEVHRNGLTGQAAANWIHAFQEGYLSSRLLDAERLAWYLQGAALRLAALYADPGFGQHVPNPPVLPVRLLGDLGSGMLMPNL